jgi:hypothetical protein
MNGAAWEVYGEPLGSLVPEDQPDRQQPSGCAGAVQLETDMCHGPRSTQRQGDELLRASVGSTNVASSRWKPLLLNKLRLPVGNGVVNGN